MPFFYGSHKVRDFAAWKPFFDADEPRRLAAGMRVEHLFRNAADANEVHLLFEVDDAEKAIAMLKSPQTQQIMRDAGVLAPPQGVILNDVV
jgi:hypothetical protein